MMMNIIIMKTIVIKKKNWSRFLHINTDTWDWYSLESKYLDIEKEENKKKFEKKLVIKKNKSKTN